MILPYQLFPWIHNLFTPFSSPSAGLCRGEKGKEGGESSTEGEKDLDRRARWRIIFPLLRLFGSTHCASVATKRSKKKGGGKSSMGRKKKDRRKMANAMTANRRPYGHTICSSLGFVITRTTTNKSQTKKKEGGVGQEGGERKGVAPHVRGYLICRYLHNLK